MRKRRYRFWWGPGPSEVSAFDLTEALILWSARQIENGQGRTPDFIDVNVDRDEEWQRVPDSRGLTLERHLGKAS